MILCLLIEKIKRIWLGDMYEHQFISAIDYTVSSKFKLDSEFCSNYKPSTSVAAVKQHLPSLLTEIINGIDRDKYDQIREYGAQCGNVHLHILTQLKRYYPDLKVNLTLGEVSYSDKVHYAFSRKDFESWLTAKPKTLDCHTWITVGSNFIIDCTIGTYIQTRVNRRDCLGGFVIGDAQQLSCQEILINKSADFTEILIDLPGLRYVPTVVGQEAFLGCAPLAPEAA